MIVLHCAKIQVGKKLRISRDGTKLYIYILGSTTENRSLFSLFLRWRNLNGN
jgi:hypothetical protein